jgi:hypothetical protein
MDWLDRYKKFANGLTGQFFVYSVQIENRLGNKESWQIGIAQNVSVRLKDWVCVWNAKQLKSE